MTPEEKLDVVERHLRAAKANLVEQALALATALEFTAKSIRAANDDLARLGWAVGSHSKQLFGQIGEIHALEHLFNSMKGR